MDGWSLGFKEEVKQPSEWGRHLQGWDLTWALVTLTLETSFYTEASAGNLLSSRASLDAQLGEFLLTSAAPSAGSNQRVNHKVPAPISFMSDEERVWDNSSLGAAKQKASWEKFVLNRRDLRPAVELLRPGGFFHGSIITCPKEPHSRAKENTITLLLSATAFENWQQPA